MGIKNDPCNDTKALNNNKVQEPTVLATPSEIT